MVVRFDLEDGGKAVADVDGAGVLARALQHAPAGGRQRLEVHARALVAAVLRPHHGEDAKLGETRLASQRVEDALVLVAGEAVLFEELIRDGHLAVANAPCVTALRTDSNMTRPSALPTASSHARSGCGIRPTTLRFSLHNPAMLFTEPLGFASGVTSP